MGTHFRRSEVPGERLDSASNVREQGSERAPQDFSHNTEANWTSAAYS